MKIAVYGVAKNEEDNIKAWYDSTKNADYHFILDTGSTDKTIEVAKSLGINVVSASFIPWDETMAKNVALSLLPADIDYCVMMDLDQKMQSLDWKEQLINSNAQEYDLVEHRLVDNVDLVNKELNNMLRRSIHNRKNSYWHKYRPSIDFHSQDIKVLTLPINIENIVGTNERFLDREKLYEDSWYREYLNALPDTYKELHIELYSTFILSNALYHTQESENILQTMPKSSPLFKNAEFKIKIINFWKYRHFSDLFKDYTKNQIIDLYSDTKTGKRKIDLAEKAYNLYSV